MRLLTFIIVIMCLILGSCATGLKTYYDDQGNVVSTDKYRKFWQMQVEKDCATIYTDKTYGVNQQVSIPVDNSPLNILKFILQIGYISETRGVIPVKPDGELPSVLVDLSTQHTKESGDLSDTYATGKVAEGIYPEDTCNEADILQSEDLMEEPSEDVPVD